MSSKKVIRIYTKNESEIEEIVNDTYSELIKFFAIGTTKKTIVFRDGFKSGCICNPCFEIHVNEYSGDTERGNRSDVVVLSGWIPSKHEYENVLFPMVFGKNGNIISYDYFYKRLLDEYMIDYLYSGGDDVE